MAQLERTGSLGVVIEAYEFELICTLRADPERSESDWKKTKMEKAGTWQVRNMGERL